MLAGALFDHIFVVLVMIVREKVHEIKRDDDRCESYIMCVLYNTFYCKINLFFRLQNKLVLDAGTNELIDPFPHVLT